MVGGAISGYCAIGSVKSAITPTSVITMLITPAKIGRSMKKCGKFIAIAIAPEPRSFCGLGLSDVRLRVWSGVGRLGHRRNVHAGLQQLQTRGNNLLAILQPALHNPFAFEHGAGLNGAALNRIVGFHDEREFEALL